MAAQAHTSRPGNGPRPLTQQKQRSIDGRQNRRFCAARPGPENHAEQAFPIARKNLNQRPCLHVAGTHRRQPQSLAEPKDTAGAQSQGTQPPERGQHRYGRI